MEQFFVGLLVGVLFSAAFYLLGILGSAYSKSRRGLIAYLWIEVLVVVAIVWVVHAWWPEFSAWWKKGHLWIHEYVRRPMHWVQFLLGVSTGVLLRIWAVRVSAGYPPAAERPPAPEKDFLRQERGWMVALVGLLLLAVLLPQIENLVRGMTALKVAGIEIAFKEQQESARAGLRPFDREKTSGTLLSDMPYAVLETRIESDNRWYAAANRTERQRANTELLKLYDVAIGPHRACMSRLIDEGYDVESVRGMTRQFVHPWHRAAISRGKDKEVAELLASMVAASRRLSSEAGCNGQWKRQEKHANATIDPVVRKSPEFFRLLAAIAYFLENQLGAIQLLESVRGEFQDDINWQSAIAALYFNEDPTLEKSLEHWEEGLRLASERLASAREQLRKSSLSCPASPGMGKPAGHACADHERYQGAVNVFKNGVAYALAHSGDPSQYPRAMQFSREAVQNRYPTRDASPTDRAAYLASLDTFAFAVMAFEAASAAPDAEAIACAQSTFRYLVGESRTSLKALSKNAASGKFRRGYLDERYTYEVWSSHLSTAAVLLSNLEKSGHSGLRCPGSQGQKMRDGTY